jgi:hypothetical protein
MLRFKVLLSIIIATIFVFSANGQVNVYSNAINFRQNNANDMQQTTYHYGQLNINSSTYYGLMVSNTGPYGCALYGQSSSGQGSIGVYGISYGSGSSNTNTGGEFYAYGGASNYGIYSYAPNQTGSYAGYFSGNVTVTGTFLNPSDQKFKTNIQPLTNCLVEVMGLKPKTFNYDTVTYSGMGFSGKKFFGLIAQDVATVMPSVVVDNIANQVVFDKGTGKPVNNNQIPCKGISYLELIPVLVGAIQEQQSEINALKAKLGN